MKKGINAILAALMLFALAMAGCPSDSDSGNGTGSGDYSYTVTFDKNNDDPGSTAPDPATRKVTSPATTVTRAPESPTRPGYIFVNYNTKADGSGNEFKTGSPAQGATVVTGDITVYAQWKIGYVVTFSKNTDDSNVSDPNPATVEFAITQSGETVTLGDKMPPDLGARPGFEFKGWNTLSAPPAGQEETTKFTKDTPVTNSITVYARWEFKGLEPKIEDGHIVHERPLFEPGTGGGINHNEGSYSLVGSGILDYKFPTAVGATQENANNYDYFIILTEILSGESGSGTGVAIRQYGNNTGFGGNGTNKQPWLSNADGKKIIQDVSGAGTTGGFRIVAQGSAAIGRFKINSITFYKAPRYTVTFKYEDGTTPDKTVTDVVGADDNLSGPGVTAAKWPEAPTREGYFFLGWKDDAGNTVTSSTPITGNVTFKAGWTDTLPEGWIELIANNGTAAPLYAFKIPAGGKLGDYDRVSFKLKASGSVTGRVRAWGTFPTSIYTLGTPAEGLPFLDADNNPTNEATHKDDDDKDVPNTANPAYKPAVPSSFPLGSTGIVNMQNAANGLLLTNSGGASTPSGITGGTTITTADGWKAHMLDLVGGRDNNYGSNNMPYKWDNDATDTIILIAIGVIPEAGGSGTKTYFIKDIVLSNADGTKKIEALDPRDNTLWNGTGQTAFVQQSPGVTTRTIMVYEAD